MTRAVPVCESTDAAYKSPLKPKPTGKPGVLRLSRRPGKFGGGKQSIRGYQWRSMSGGQSLLVDNLFAPLYPEHPSRFKWKRDELSGRYDMGALSRFIDAIYLGRTELTHEEQEAGRAFDLEYTAGNVPTERFYLRLPQLLSIMSLKGEVPLPLWGRISFLTDGSNLVPAEMMTLLAAVAPHLFAASPPGTKWREVKTEGDLFRTLKLRPEQVTASMYRNCGPVGGPKGPQPLPAAERPGIPPAQVDPGWSPPEERSAPAESSTDDAPTAPVAETPVVRNEGRGYVELITRVESRPQPHFARRVLAQGRTVYSATSWNLSGPWHVWERDVSAMLGLGLT
jgi:hypothetical protein